MAPRELDLPGHISALLSEPLREGRVHLLGSGRFPLSSVRLAAGLVVRRFAPAAGGRPRLRLVPACSQRQQWPSAASLRVSVMFESSQPPSLAEARLAATAAALDGDPGSLYSIVSQLLDEGISFDTILFEVLMPVERDVGQRWHQGDYLIAEEHALTATIETVVSLLAGSLEQPEHGKHIVVAAAEGDDHSLPGRVISAFLLYQGYRTTFLGSGVVAADLGEYLQIEQPNALVLSCATVVGLPGARAAIAASHAAGVPVLVGGRGFGTDGSRAAVMGADAWAAVPAEIPNVLESWSPDPEAAEAAATATATGSDLAAARSSVVAAVELRLKDSGVMVDSRLKDEIVFLARAVESAAQVSEEVIINETVAWQSSLLHSHGLDYYPQLVSALAEFYGHHSEWATDRLTRAAARLS